MRLILLLPLLVLSACASAMRSSPSVLPPPPRDWLRVSPLSAPPEVQSGIDSVPELSGTTAPDIRLPGRLSDAQEGLRPRFGRPLPPPAAGSPGAARARVREEAPADDLGWQALSAQLDSIDFHGSWERLHAAMRAGTDVGVRNVVWPEGARVMRREPGRIVIAAGWIDARRIPANEMRCEAAGDRARHEPDQVGEARLVAEVIAGERGGARVFTRLETRGLAGCEGSHVLLDRLTAYRGDVWMGASRAASPTHPLFRP
jgi:hypothetical protein